MDLNDLIGRRFRRCKYGLSSWTAVIERVHYTHRCLLENGEWHWYPRVYVTTVENPDGPTYNLDEIVLLDLEEKQMQREIRLQEAFERIKRPPYEKD